MSVTNRPIRILFVCHGNICRSPMAEFIFKDMVLSLIHISEPTRH
mgnify:CR=1 FL=1